ncbi:gastrula zinc finger protein XlCGF8.2DB-like, partial [Contarinia nasturtii]|uniref:gastrula zinc finger protein XlCGF8.2DB-like n=1 Tax=Contarinia nasturtii TaxID=265458 RepID=UPI0012D37368
MRTHAKQFPFQCSICRQGFTVKRTKETHEKNCNPRRFECYLCKYDTLYKTHLVNHIRIHTGELPFKCNICAKRFSVKNTLKGHMRTHAKQFPFQCSICRQGFTVKRIKEMHEKNCNPRRFECYLCKYATFNKTHIVDHMCIHTGARSFRCSHCAKRFAKKSDFESHLKRLNGKAKVQVQELFTVEEWLEIETNSNGTEQPKGSTSGVKSKTKCEFCNYVAKCPAQLITHGRKHTGEKPFECNICAKGFTRKENLNKHMRTHEKHFPFHCSICLQGFKVKRTKETHEKNCNPRRFE